MSETLSSGLTITIPTIGETNWDQTIKLLCFQKISEHDHTGGGKGIQIGTTALAADSVTSAKIRLTNNQFLRARNAANSADISLIGLDSSNNASFQNTAGAVAVQAAGAGFEAFMQCTATGNIGFYTGSTRRWEIVDTNGKLRTTVDNTYDIGDSTHHTRNAFIVDLQTSGLNQTIGPVTNNVLSFRQNNVNYWQLGGSGALVPVTDGVGTLGSATNQILSITSRQFIAATIVAPANPSTGWSIYADSGGNLNARSAGGTVRTLALA